MKKKLQIGAKQWQILRRSPAALLPTSPMSESALPFFFRLAPWYAKLARAYTLVNKMHIRLPTLRAIGSKINAHGILLGDVRREVHEKSLAASPPNVSLNVLSYDQREANTHRATFEAM